MSDPNYPTQPGLPPANGGGNLRFPILLGAVLALVAANIYLFLQIDGLKKDQTKQREQLLEDIARLRETSSVSTQAAKRNLETLQDQLEAARRQASMAVGQAKVDATKHAEDLAKKLEQQQRLTEAAIRSEVSDVKSDLKQVASTATTKIGEVSGEVSSVRTEVAATKAELDKTIQSLKSVSGDLGVQSGLIATNGRELAALRALGERNYFEFNLAKTKLPQRIGDVMLQLTKADEKRNRYTVLVIADDKKVEKKDKGLHEPVQFYTSKARQPYEIVVNEVKKDVIVGYLATPKVQGVRN